MDYISSVVELVNQKRGLGDTISEGMVVGKVLRSLWAKYNLLVTAIEESKDISKLTMDELNGTLKAHEARRQSQADESEEKILHVKIEGKALHVKSETSGAK